MEDNESDNDEEISTEKGKGVSSGMIRNIEMGQIYGQKSNGEDQKDGVNKQNGEGNKSMGIQTTKLAESERNNKNNNNADGNSVKHEDIYRRIEESDAI